MEKDNSLERDNGIITQRSTKARFATKTLVTMALLAAISIVLSRFCVIYFTDSLRLSFGNIPIIITGLLFGPIAGALVGAVTDILGSLLFSGLGWYPPLTVTPVIIGLVAGLLRRFVLKRQQFYRFAAATLIANALGTICWSTFCLSKLYGTPFWTLAGVRVPFYIGVALLEALVIFVLFKSKVFSIILKDDKFMQRVKK